MQHGYLKNRSIKIQFRLIFGLICCMSLLAGADIPRALPMGQQLADHRLEPLKSTRNGYFPFNPPPSKEQWEARSETLRRQTLVSLGLWPLPDKTPMNAVVHGTVEREDYTIAKVYFESCPGFYVTGNLYRPKDRNGPYPGVLCPYGHWPNGRFGDRPQQDIRRDLDQGAEQSELSARNTIETRCVQLARMGCVVFVYDMIGYADSQQIAYDIAHFYKGNREALNTLEHWGLYSAQAGAHLQTVMGLQTWNSIRSLDFLLSLEDVDPKRIGVTGASSGATQAFILGAIDPRPTVLFPACMVGTAMQGGCTCENASLLRINTGNVELAGLFAPKPMGLTAADDWTKEMSTKGYPELRQLYRLLGAPDHVALTSLTQFRHNYNAVSRQAMYHWFNRYLQLGLADPILEKNYQPLTLQEMTVWDKQHPAPAGGPAFEQGLLNYLTQMSRKKVQQARTSVKAYRDLVQPALNVIIGRTYATAGMVTFIPSQHSDHQGIQFICGLLHNQRFHEQVPIVTIQPSAWQGKTILWITSQGKAGLFNDDGTLMPAVQKLIDANIEIVGIDLFLQGEFLDGNEPPTRNRRVENDYHYEAFTYGYNHPLLAQRVHDILSAISYLSHREPKVRQLTMVGLDNSGPWVGIAAALAHDVIDRVAINTKGFRFSKLLDVYDVNFLPGGAKYGDLPGIIALNTPTPLWLAGDTGSDIVREMYRLDKAEANLRTLAGEQNVTENAVNWLRQP